ncbi:MAG: metallophosphoesterase family protein [Clostridia bacterium]|nr:metallophosphoesterase family protein [Clostridia bacterium]
MNLKKDIKFRNGKFKILQISDLQDTKSTDVDTIRFLNSALEKLKPDLVVFTGDQLDVAGLWNIGNREDNVCRAIKGLFTSVERSGIPFILTFGNHDRQTGIPNEKQAEIYSGFSKCICFGGADDGRPDCGTFNLPVYSSDGSRAAMNIYMFDTHSNIAGGKIEPITDGQLEWYRRTSETLSEENGGKVPSIVFQHIPPAAIYDMMREVPKGTPKSHPAFGSRKGKFYALGDKVTYSGDYGETPSVTDTDGREFGAFKEQGDVFAVFCGHDHYNSFVGKVDGIDIGYCPGAGYSTYGLKERQIRLFEFDENDVENYATKIVKYSDVCKSRLAKPVKNLVYSNAPSCPAAAPKYIIKGLSFIASLAFTLAVFYILVSPTLVNVFLATVTTASLIYIVFSLVYGAVVRNRLLR